MGEAPVRPAEPSDAPALAAIAERAYAPYVPRIGIRPAPMDADYVQAIAHDEVWVADGDGPDPAGFVVLCDESDHLLLENVAVDPAYQGRGLGRILLDLAERRAVEIGLPEVRLFTHVGMTENQQIYERRGYDETHRLQEEHFARVFYRKVVP